MPKEFHEMTPVEKQKRIAFLWKKVRMMVHMRGSIQDRIDEMQRKARANHGLSDDEEDRFLGQD